MGFEFSDGMSTTKSDVQHGQPDAINSAKHRKCALYRSTQTDRNIIPLTMGEI